MTSNGIANWSDMMGVACCGREVGVSFLFDCHMHICHGIVKSRSLSLPWCDHTRDIVFLLMIQSMDFWYCIYPIPPIRYASLGGGTHLVLPAPSPSIVDPRNRLVRCVVILNHSSSSIGDPPGPALNSA